MLLLTFWRVRPRLHVFGHIHAARGVEHVSWDVCLRGFQRRGRHRKIVRVVVGMMCETNVGTGNGACECGECGRRTEKRDSGGHGFSVVSASIFVGIAGMDTGLTR